MRDCVCVCVREREREGERKKEREYVRRGKREKVFACEDKRES